SVPRHGLDDAKPLPAGIFFHFRQALSADIPRPDFPLIVHQLGHMGGLAPWGTAQVVNHLSRLRVNCMGYQGTTFVLDVIGALMEQGVIDPEMPGENGDHIRGIAPSLDSCS